MLLGFEFVEASAYSKLINCITNLTALLVFISQGKYLLELAILMALCNVAGNLAGSRLALKRGNGFVRIFFLIIVMAYESPCWERKFGCDQQSCQSLRVISVRPNLYGQVHYK